MYWMLGLAAVVIVAVYFIRECPKRASVDFFDFLYSKINRGHMRMPEGKNGFCNDISFKL